MKQVMKKFVTFALTVTMLLGLTVTAQAETAPDAGTTEEVTITGLPTDKEVTFDTYQIVKGVYTPESNSLEYALTDWAKAALVGNGKNYETEEKALEAIAALPTTGESATEQADLLNLLAAASGKTAYVNEDDEVTFTQAADSAANTYADSASAELPVGSYLVIAHNPTMSFLNMLVSVDTSGTADGAAADAWTLTAKGAVLKGRELEADKEITGKKDTDSEADTTDTDPEAETKDMTVQIGDVLGFKVTADVPQYPLNSTKTTFKVVDTPKNIGIKADTVQVYGVNSAEAETPLVKDIAYTVDLDPENGVLTVDFSDYYKNIFLKTDGSYPYASVKLTYDAEILSTAALEGSNTNDAKLVYNNDPYNDTGYDTEVPVPPGDEPKVYTFGADITKFAERTDDGEQVQLANAVFHVSRDGEDLTFVKAEGVYKVADSTRTNAGADLTTGEDGTLSLVGLDADVEYVLYEAGAPAGYHLNTNRLSFSITAEKNTEGKLTGAVASVTAMETLSDGTTEVEADSRTWTCGLAKKKGALEVSLTDTRLLELPATGGIGTTIFTAAGVILILAAAALFFAGRRRKER